MTLSEGARELDLESDVIFRDKMSMLVAACCCLLAVVSAWVPTTTITTSHVMKQKSRVLSAASSSSSSIFSEAPTLSLDRLKSQILQLGAALDRGQAYNPTSGDYYKSTMGTAKEKILQLLQDYPDQHAKSLADMEGEWELVLSTVPHGIFRSSPFFLAVQEAFSYAEEKGKKRDAELANSRISMSMWVFVSNAFIVFLFLFVLQPTEAFGEDKALLFFKLHELQTCSWGVSKVGRVAQYVDPKDGYLFSAFDTSIFSLTVIPILGWFKLLPTFGGCVITAAKCTGVDGSTGQLDMVVDYTTSRPVPGLSGLGEWIWSVKVPVGAIWKLLPWGREATCSVVVKYVDEDFRIVEDTSGDLFVYTRPVVGRDLGL